MRTYVRIPLTALSDKNTKHETLLFNINKIANSSDISQIDYTEGGTAYHKLETLNSMLYDNLIVYTEIPDSDFEDIKKLKS